jgi:hypothetical protein
VGVDGIKAFERLMVAIPAVKERRAEKKAPPIVGERAKRAPSRRKKELQQDS